MKKYLDLEDFYRSVNRSDITAATDEHIDNSRAKLKNILDDFRKELYTDVVIQIKYNSILDILIEYQQHGRFDTLDLLTVEDTVLFHQYTDLRRFGFTRFLDVGANLGVHTLVAQKLGYQVTAYEPDPDTFQILRRNVQLNSSNYSARDSANPDLHQIAVSDSSGIATFTKLSDNPFGNHIKGTKVGVYGPRHEIAVEVIDASRLPIGNGTIVKIDAEGSDAKILKSIFSSKHSIRGDLIVVLGDWREETRGEIFETIRALSLEASNPMLNTRVHTTLELPLPGSNNFIFVRA